MRETYVAQNARTAWRVYSGEAVILCPDDGTLNTLNAVGTRIWESADGKTPVTSIIARICAEFEVEAEQAEQDTMAFIMTLRDRGLVAVSETIQTP